MAWNEPGGNKEKDPWNNGDQGPPDLDEAFRKFKQKFGAGGGNNKGGSQSDLPSFNGKMLAVVLIIAAIGWALLGVYQVDQQENAVVLRLGKYYQTVPAGLNWHPLMVDKVQKVNITRVRSTSWRGMMLTEDDNIVQIAMSVQWTVKDPKDFLLKVRDPELSLKHAAESALRHAVGGAEMHQVLTEGRMAIATEVQERIQAYLDTYGAGILIAKVNIDDAQPPEQVQAAFDDVIRAKEDESRLKNQAETYRNGLIPEARGYAMRQMEEANAYKGQVIAEATGETQRFLSLLTEYEKSPKVTRERLYLDSMQRLLGGTSKVMMDADSGNIMYLPLDKMMGQSLKKSDSAKSSYTELSLPKSQTQAPSSRSSNRSVSREAR
ncbi:MAG: FtsH protease activity modulator HflK [Cellvibrionales bacterium]|nr:FtsH protease activity modulator HflK [Cellvibrionales bacterium]